MGASMRSDKKSSPSEAAGRSLPPHDTATPVLGFGGAQEGDRGGLRSRDDNLGGDGYGCPGMEAGNLAPGVAGALGGAAREPSSQPVLASPPRIAGPRRGFHELPLQVARPADPAGHGTVERSDHEPLDRARGRESVAQQLLDQLNHHHNLLVQVSVPGDFSWPSSKLGTDDQRTVPPEDTALSMQPQMGEEKRGLDAPPLGPGKAIAPPAEYLGKAIASPVEYQLSAPGSQGLQGVLVVEGEPSEVRQSLLDLIGRADVQLQTIATLGETALAGDADERPQTPQLDQEATSALDTDAAPRQLERQGRSLVESGIAVEGKASESGQAQRLRSEASDLRRGAAGMGVGNATPGTKDSTLPRDVTAKAEPPEAPAISARAAAQAPQESVPLPAGRQELERRRDNMEAAGKASLPVEPTKDIVQQPAVENEIQKKRAHERRHRPQ